MSSTITYFHFQPNEVDYSHFGIYPVFSTVETIVHKSPTPNIWESEISPSSISSGSSSSVAKKSNFFPISPTYMYTQGTDENVLHPESLSLKEIWESVPSKNTKQTVVSPKKPAVQPINKPKMEKKQKKARLPAKKVMLQLKPRSV